MQFGYFIYKFFDHCWVEVWNFEDDPESYAVDITLKQFPHHDYPDVYIVLKDKLPDDFQYQNWRSLKECQPLDRKEYLDQIEYLITKGTKEEAEEFAQQIEPTMQLLD